VLKTEWMTEYKETQKAMEGPILNLDSKFGQTVYSVKSSVQIKSYHRHHHLVIIIIIQE
jgi:hypothetical protein